MPKQLIPESPKLILVSDDAFYSLESVPNSKRMLLAQGAHALVSQIDSRAIRIVRTVPATMPLSQLELCVALPARGVLSPVSLPQPGEQYFSIQRQREHALRQAVRAHGAKYLIFRDAPEDIWFYKN